MEPTEPNPYDPRCRHCLRVAFRVGRRLCRLCHADPLVLALYPAAPRNSRGVGTDNPAGVLPSEPTDALPGTEGKVKEMCRRAALGTSLWHPLDARGVEGERRAAS